MGGATVIVGSIVLVLVAAVLLVLGLARRDETLFYSSIVASALAALALLVGVRQFPAGRLPEADFDVRSSGPGLAPRPPRPVGRAGVPRQSRMFGDATYAGDTLGTSALPGPIAPPARSSDPGAALGSNGSAGDEARTGAGQARVEDGADMAEVDQASLERADGAVPADEPDEQPMTDREGVAMANIGTEVIVIDGRPRYHVTDCMHLLGRTVQRVPAREAMVLGFTPCSLCDPVAHLLNQA